jgi:hypothetical protein
MGQEKRGAAAFVHPRQGLGRRDLIADEKGGERARLGHLIRKGGLNTEPCVG